MKLLCINDNWEPITPFMAGWYLPKIGDQFTDYQLHKAKTDPFYARADGYEIRKCNIFNGERVVYFSRHFIEVDENEAAETNIAAMTTEQWLPDPVRSKPKPVLND